MIINSTFQKDPSSVLDYKFDWRAFTNGSSSDPEISDWLAAGESISTYTITSTSGIIVDSSSLTDSNSSVTVWLSGGLDFCDYKVACLINTNNSTPRTDERTITIQVRNR
jgi:hypothetical protein